MMQAQAETEARLREQMATAAKAARAEPEEAAKEEACQREEAEPPARAARCASVTW